MYKQKKTHSFLYVGNLQNSYFGGGLLLFQLLVTFTPQHMFFTFKYAFSWPLLADLTDSKVSFNKRKLSESYLFMRRSLNIQEFLVYDEIIKVRQNFLYVPNLTYFGFGGLTLKTLVINPLTPGCFSTGLLST